MPELVYHGWSCFTLTTARGLKTVFDPNWTKPFGRPSAGPAAFADADLCLVTHGHFDHIQDVPGLMKDSRMALAASPEVCRFLRETHGSPADRMRELEIDQSIIGWNGPDRHDVRMGTLDRRHREDVRGAARGESDAVPLHFSNPYDARRMGFTVNLDNGLRVTWRSRERSSTTRGRSRRRRSFFIRGVSCSSPSHGLLRLHRAALEPTRRVRRGRP